MSVPTTPAPGMSSYPPFDATAVILKNYDTESKQLLATLPSPMLPICSEREAASYLVQFQPDLEVELAADRRLKQGRGPVFAACCRILNPLEALPVEGTDVTHETYKMTELLLRAKEPERLKLLHETRIPNRIPEVLRISASDEDTGSLVALGRMNVAVIPFALVDCLDTKRLVPQIRNMRQDHSDLCVGEGTSSRGDVCSQARTTLAQFVVALHGLRPGGTLILKLMSLNGVILTGLLYAAVRWFFTGAVVLCKPDASCPAHAEVYLIACGRARNEDVTAAKGPSLASLIVWLERSALMKNVPDVGQVRVFHRDEHMPPFTVAESFRICVDYWSRRYAIMRQETMWHALKLCRVIIEHRPIVRQAQLDDLVMACTRNVALREIAANYLEKWPSHALRPMLSRQWMETLELLRNLPQLEDKSSQ